jgi:Leucine-rich repeat (LRR) protein
MYLEIINKDGLDLDSFCEYLIKQMQDYMKSETRKNYKRLAKYNEFIDENVARIDDKETILPIRDILVLSTYYLTYKQLPDSYVIELNPNINVPNTYAKFIDIVKLVNYGNLSLPAYPIYDEMMDYFADKIVYFYKEYKGE